MCGRFVITSPPAALRQIFGYLDQPNFPPRYNIAPTQPIPVVIIENGIKHFRLMRWGLLPAWVTDPRKFTLLINARAETVLEKPAFKNAVKRRRCLILADGYFEWKAETPKKKQPFYFHLKDDAPFAFAGIWDPAAEDLPAAYCILTSAPNELVSRVHDRMPVILTADAMVRWIGDRPLSDEEFRLLVSPIASERMASRPVSRFVSNSRNEGPGCLAPPDDAPPEPELDFT